MANSARRRAYAVTRVLAEADSLAAAAPHVLRAIGENLEWEWGALWSVHERGYPAPLRLPLACAGYRDRGIRHGLPRADLRGRRRPARSGLAKRKTNLDGRCDDRTRILARLGGGESGAAWRRYFPDPPRHRSPWASSSSLAARLGNATKSSSPHCRRSAARSASSSSASAPKRRLRASEERWRRLFETSSAGMALFRLDGVCTAANPALQRMLGRAEEEIVGHNVLELNHEDERAATAEALARDTRSGSLTERHVEKKYLRKDGTPVWLNITNDAGAGNRDRRSLSAVGLYGHHRTRAGSKRRCARAKSAGEPMFETDRCRHCDSAILSTEDMRRRIAAFQRMTGYTEDELRNLTVLDITPEEDRAATRKRIRRDRCWAAA